MKKLIPWIVAIAASGTAFHFWKLSNERLAMLSQLQAEMENQKAASAEAMDSLKKRQSEVEIRQQAQLQELLKLRDQARQARANESELNQTRQQLQRALAEKSAAGNTPQAQEPASSNRRAQTSFPRDQWSFAGYQSPESALVSAIWAMREGNPTTYFQSLSPTEQDRISKLWADKSQEDIVSKHQSDVSRITGLQVLESRAASDHEMVLSVEIQGTGRTEQVSMQKIGEEWKFGGFIRK